jgi:hypothetical protein
VFDELHVTGRPVRRFPAASRALAVSCCVPPTTRLVDGGDTLTAATGTSETVRTATPDTPSTVAATVAEPAATAVTTPVAETLATAVFDELHVTGRPVRRFPAASRALAVSCCVPPTTRLADEGDTLTAATGTGETVTAAAPVTPSTVAEIVAFPAATAVTIPVAETLATAVFDEIHVTGRPIRTFPAASRALAVSCCVPPTNRPEAAGDTLTDATGTGRTVMAAVATNPSTCAEITD